MMSLKDCRFGFLQIQPSESNRQWETDDDGCMREIDDLLHPPSRSIADSYLVGAMSLLPCTPLLGLPLCIITRFMLESVAETFACKVQRGDGEQL